MLQYNALLWASQPGETAASAAKPTWTGGAEQVAADAFVVAVRRVWTVPGCAAAAGPGGLGFKV